MVVSPPLIDGAPSEAELISPLGPRLRVARPAECSSQECYILRLPGLDHTLFSLDVRDRFPAGHAQNGRRSLGGVSLALAVYANLMGHISSSVPCNSMTALCHTAVADHATLCRANSRDHATPRGSLFLTRIQHVP